MGTNTRIGTSVKSASLYLREITGEKITIHEVYAYIRLGLLAADYISHTFIIYNESLEALAEQIISNKKSA